MRLLGSYSGQCQRAVKKYRLSSAYRSVGFLINTYIRAPSNISPKKSNRLSARYLTRMRSITPLLPGLALTTVGVGVAYALSVFLPTISALTIAVILGVIVGNTAKPLRIRTNPLAPGLKFAAKKLLRVGIVLLGFRLALSDIAALGWRGLTLVIVIVLLTFFGTQLVGRLLGLNAGVSLLVATGFSICGVSAIAAVDGVTKNRDEDVAAAIALVTMCGTLAIAVLPLLQHPLGLSEAEFGMWAGASVHDVAQVVATASVAGSSALAIAIVVKLTRVVMLAPLVAGVALVERRRTRTTTADKRPAIVPLFVLAFLGAVAVRSTGVLPAAFIDGAKLAETLMLAAALFGLGFAVHLPTLFRTGGRTAILGLASWIVIGTASFIGVTLIDGASI